MHPSLLRGVFLNYMISKKQSGVNKKTINNNPYKRIVLVILDSVGCGARPDYKKYHSSKRNTLLNVCNANQNLRLPNLEKIGLSKILFDKEPQQPYVAGKMQSLTTGNDTFTGIWEMLGVVIKKKFKPQINGLDKKTLRQLEKKIKTPLVGNEYIIGMEAIKKFFREHEEKKAPILYFSDDGAIFLAAHTSIISPEKLYKISRQVAEFFENKNASRIITRPFTGLPGNFIRHEDLRRDIIIAKGYLKESIIPRCLKNNIKIITSQHIHNFLEREKSVDAPIITHNNLLALSILKQQLKTVKQKAFMMVCLQDFDVMGHRHDAFAYGYKLKEFDNQLPTLLKQLDKDDLLIITADHGSDPTYNLRGHTREYVPLILYSKRNQKTIDLGIRNTFADIAQTVCDNFNLPLMKAGKTLKIF